MTHSARWWIALAALLGTMGCGSPLSQVLLPDSKPDVKLTSVRVDSPTPDSYAYMARWVGVSTGRTIDHYVVAIDPVSVDAVDARWVKTTATQQVLAFPREEKPAGKRRPHVFVVRAVDDRGMMSEPKVFTFTENNLPPVVRIVEPDPSALFVPTLPSTTRFHWTGVDPDGQTTTHPVRYVYRVFGQYNPDRLDIVNYVAFARLYPDSVRAFYAPDFPGWQSAPGETTSARVENLTPAASHYLFMVTGFDEAGDYDPAFAAGKNMLEFSVANPGTGGPILTMYNQFFNYTYPDSRYIVDPSRTVRLEVPADQVITICWYATPAPGATIDCYRWVMDLRDLSSPLIRKSDSMWFYWSRCSNHTCATIGPFRTNGEEHLLYVEARDSNGLRSLGIVLLRVVRATFERNLLFVDDTRLRPDRASGTPGQVLPPGGQWPTAAELDTFLFARGGFPWRSYPPGTISPPGIFSGYDFDTLGTRGVSADGTVPLSFLTRYRHVVWCTDELGASYAGSPSDRSSPITSLRLMNGPGQPNALATYVRGGGMLWLCGGGAAYATLIPWNKPGTPPNEYNNLEPNPELHPGRFMYDFAHWRDAIHMNVASNAQKFGTTSFGVGSNRPGRHWPPNPTPPTPPSPPDYSLLPAILNPKTAATDPPPPFRFTDSFWLRQDYTAEFIPTGVTSTYIREDYNDDPNVEDLYSTLDTLYIVGGGLVALPNSPVMTYYHGRENAPMVFSGFNIWYWRRDQCIALVDWVLQNVWGLTRAPSASREPAAAAAGIARR